MLWPYIYSIIYIYIHIHTYICTMYVCTWAYGYLVKNIMYIKVFTNFYFKKRYPAKNLILIVRCFIVILINTKYVHKIHMLLLYTICIYVHTYVSINF